MRRRVKKGKLDFAGTLQFRNAVSTIVGDCGWHGSGYTDKAKSTLGIRFVKIYCSRPTEKQMKDIEFILWSQGVTANTRRGSFGIRGTCVMKDKK